MSPAVRSGLTTFLVTFAALQAFDALDAGAWGWVAFWTGFIAVMFAYAFRFGRGD